MSAKAKTTLFTKDTNNNLSNKQCEEFIKDYKEYKNGKISKLTNPKTNKQLNDADRIKYIYEKCKVKLGIGSVSPKSKSPKSKSPEPEDNKIILDSYEKVQDIIYIPLNTLAQNKKLIASLFTKPIKYDIGLLKLYEYLNLQPQNTQNIYVKSYHKILHEINKIIRIIYHYKRMSTEILTTEYKWKLNYNYNPFGIPENGQLPNIIDAIKTTQKTLQNMWKNTKYLYSDEYRCFGLNNQPIDEIKKIIIYSENNNNKDDVIRNLDDNMEKYVALQFILVIIRDELSDIYLKLQHIDSVNLHLNILDSLITKDIVNILFDNNNSSYLSISKSISRSGTPRSSSSNHSHFQSKANIARYRKTKADLVAAITENNINDMDPYLAEKWEDMSLNKLKNVISLKYKEGDNTYGTAFYIRTLYQAWEHSVKYHKPFRNPYTRKDFTDNDKEDIMNAIILMYPGIQRPKVATGRRDISLSSLHINNTIVISFKYILKINKMNISIPIIRITYPLIFDIDVEPAYIQQYLFENILQLNKTKKTFGKDALLKPLPVLLEYNDLSLYNYYQYKDFFDKIKNAL
jgi:hypothetical protein